jgi:adenine phosphoribosyltransferase
MEYDLEYGKDVIEMHHDALNNSDRVLIVDDLLATGGTCSAACRLVEKVGAEVSGCAFVVNLPDLKGFQKIEKYKPFYLVSFEGE